MPRLERKHSLATRLFHWTNVPVLAVMIWSGLLIYWANDVYAIRLGGITLVKFFPDVVLPSPCTSTTAWRRGWPGTSPSCGSSPSTACSTSPTRPGAGSGGTSCPNRHTFAEAWQVVLHDLGLRKEPLAAAEVQRRPAARLHGRGRDGGRLAPDGPGDLQAGPARLAHHAAGRLPAARLEHFVLTVGYVVFFVIHITQVVRAGWNNFRAMVIGVEVAADEEVSYENAGRADAASESTPTDDADPRG